MNLGWKVGKKKTDAKETNVLKNVRAGPTNALAKAKFLCAPARALSVWCLFFCASWLCFLGVSVVLL